MSMNEWVTVSNDIFLVIPDTAYAYVLLMICNTRNMKYLETFSIRVTYANKLFIDGSIWEPHSTTVALQRGGKVSM